jgi:septal ring factor EnvC (AmiA/AmiB activator)
MTPSTSPSGGGGSSPEGAPEPADRWTLAAAYDEQGKLLYEARSGLAEAVRALTEELNEQRQETSRLRDQVARLQADNRALDGELRHTHALIEELRNSKLMRWTALPRRAVYRARSSRR